MVPDWAKEKCVAISVTFQKKKPTMHTFRHYRNITRFFIIIIFMRTKKESAVARYYLSQSTRKCLWRLIICKLTRAQMVLMRS